MSVKIEKITQEEFDKKEAGRKISKWKQIIADVKRTKIPVKITGLRRGQVASGYRAAKEAKLQVKVDYKNGELWLSP